MTAKFASQTDDVSLHKAKDAFAEFP